MNDPFQTGTHPLVLAHRGDSLHAPANTLPAFARAVQYGADALELDVHWTKDGVLVVSHDADVDAASDGTGAIRDKTLSELKRLDFGYRFTGDGGRTHPFRGRGVRIPTLCEVLAEFPHTAVNVDIKPARLGSLQKLLLDLHDARATWRIVIASFHHETLRRIRQMSPAIATSASPREVFALRFWPFHTWRHLPFFAVQVPVSMAGIQVVNERFIARAHAASVQVHVWTIDDAAEMARLFRLGVDGVVTNHPAVAARIRAGIAMDGMCVIGSVEKTGTTD